MTLIGLIMGNGIVLFAHQVLGLYSSDEEVILYGIQRLKVICTWYFFHKAEKGEKNPARHTDYHGGMHRGADLVLLFSPVISCHQYIYSHGQADKR